MESCRKLIERAKKRVMRAEDLIKQLESEAAAPAFSEPVVAGLQRQIDALILERDSLRGMRKVMPGLW